jgi:hypothetical protein
VTRILAASLSLICLYGAHSARAGSIEAVFEDAARYTVKIETTTEHPFLDDQLGTTIGAGFMIDRDKG